MAYSSAKQGWYKPVYPEKFIQQVKESKTVMNSTRFVDGNLEIQYKSSLEYKAIKYADFNKFIIKYSLEPFPVKYLKPTDGKFHRYFVDLYIEFSSGDKFLVEIKSSSETKEPRKPSKKTQKALMNYQKALETWYINCAKWEAAKKFATLNNMKFIILTELELK